MIHSDEDEDMQVDYDDDLGKVNLLQSHIKTLPHVLADGGSTHNVFTMLIECYLYHIGP